MSAFDPLRTLALRLDQQPGHDITMHMKAVFWIAGAVLLAACSEGNENSLPNDFYVNLIERKLAQHPCIGDLSKWERNYRLAKPVGISAYTAHANLDVIEFHLRRAGTTTILPGRNVLRRGEMDDWPDGKYIQFIDGRYRIGGNLMYLSRCPSLEKSRHLVPRDGA